MDLFSQFPESNNKNEFLPRINDEKIDNDNLEDASEKEKNSLEIRFDNTKKVKILRNRNKYILIIVIILFFLVKFTFDDFLRELSIKLIKNYGIKKEIVKTVVLFINKISPYLFDIFFFIIYLRYPLQYSFSYILSFIVIKYIQSLLFLVYGVDRDKDKGIEAFFENGSEKPNIQLQNTFITFFGYWRLLKSKPRTKKQSNLYKRFANIIFCISVIITIFTFIEEILVRDSSINMCLIGLIIAIALYTILYERFCVQFMKGKIFIKSLAKNIFLFTFISFIQLLVAVSLYHNYNGISDVFEVFDYNPWKDDDIVEQNVMNRIVLKKSLFVLFMLSIVMGIRKNYKFVISKKNKNYYNLEDIVQFNKDEKKAIILKRVFLCSIPPIFSIILMNYLQYAYKIQLVFYLFSDFLIYGYIGLIYFGYIIKKSLKKHLDEGRELEDYQNLNYSDQNINKKNKENQNNQIDNIM